MSVVARTFALLGGAVSYAAHLLFASALVPWACEVGSTLPLHVVTALALTGVLASAFAGWRILRHRDSGVDASGGGFVAAQDGPGSASWMAGTGLLLNGLFTLIILYGEIPTWFLDPCSP